MTSTAATPLLQTGRTSTMQSSRTMRRAAFVVAGLCGMALLSMVIMTRPVARTELMTSISAAQKDNIMTQTNAYRCMHGAPAVTWDDAIAIRAQAWANTLATQNGCNMQHSKCDAVGNPSLTATGICSWGENIAWASNPKFYDTFPAGFVDAWYDEVNNYNFAVPGEKLDASKPIGHFTQLVWAGSTKMGCGGAQCAGAVVTVCQYDPPGNYQTKMAENVKPLDSTKTAASCGKLSKPADTCPVRYSCQNAFDNCFAAATCNGATYTCGTCTGTIDATTAPAPPPPAAACTYSVTGCKMTANNCNGQKLEWVCSVAKGGGSLSIASNTWTQDNTPMCSKCQLCQPGRVGCVQG